MTRFKTWSSPLCVMLALLPLGCGVGATDDGQTSEAELALASQGKNDKTRCDFSLSGPKIKPGALLPSQFTCNNRAFGDGSSPQLDWKDEPKGTKSYAILLKDLTIEAGQSAEDTNPEHPFHWTIWNIKGSAHTLPASLGTAQFPLKGDKKAQQQNGGPPFISPGAYGYFGPCPNLGALAFGQTPETHNDVFIIYAFADAQLQPPAYDPGPDPANPLNPVRQLANFYEGHPSLLGKAELPFTANATPKTCPGFPNPPFTCQGS